MLVKGTTARTEFGNLKDFSGGSKMEISLANLAAPVKFRGAGFLRLLLGKIKESELQTDSWKKGYWCT